MYLYFDESGDWSDNERYYIIGGFLVDDRYKIRRVMKKALRDVRRKFPSLNNKIEIKASDCPSIAKDYILMKISKVPLGIYYLSIDKNHVDSHNKKGKAQNRFYNYTLGIMCCFIAKHQSSQRYDCLIDERNISVGSLNSFEDYINIKTTFEDKIKTTFEIKYGDSKKYYELQVADFICNAFWTKENYPLTDHFSSILNPNLKKRLKFPLSKHGK